MEAKEGPFCLASPRRGPGGVECIGLGPVCTPERGSFGEAYKQRMTLWSSGGQLEMKGRLTGIVSPLGIRCRRTLPLSESQVLALDGKMKGWLSRPD